MKKRIALVLSGGGLRGQFEVGAIKTLKEFGLEFDYIGGISFGALAGAYESMGKSGEFANLMGRIPSEGVSFAYTSDFLDLSTAEFRPKVESIMDRLIPKLDIWQKIRLLSKAGRKDIAEKIIANIKGVKGLADNTPMYKILLSAIKRSDFKIPIEFGAVSLTTGEYLTLSPDDFETDEELAKFILASSNMPLVWPPIPSVKTRKGEFTNLVDGGLRNISPVGAASDYIDNSPVDNDDWLMIVVNCGTGYLRPLASTDMNILSIANRSLNDIALSEIMQNDIDGLLRINNIVKQSSEALKSPSGRLYKKYDVMLIQPDEDSLGATLDASPELMQKRHLLGVEKTLNAMEWAKKENLI